MIAQVYTLYTSLSAAFETCVAMYREDGQGPVIPIPGPISYVLNLLYLHLIILLGFLLVLSQGR